MSESLSREAELGSLASALTSLASAPSDLLVRGTVIDAQYRIERVIGHGGMGVVYLARDLKLERDVAIKLARERSEIAFARSSREAVALARLSHPNVVVIHQVGELDGRVYVAMEHIAGTTARAWCETPRSVREIIALYVAVGDGLAAAHAAGLVHHDFKPDNVLVGDDGRARVADFGLARPEAAIVVEPTTGDPSTAAGTPAYMAPEQYRREDVDARADQFSFCASIWEALHRVRPFASPLPGIELQRGEAEQVRRIPRHVDAALRRGLTGDREARWPSLAPLLAELRRDPMRRRTAIAAGTGVLGLGALAVAFALRGGAPVEDPCSDGLTRIETAWSPPRAAAVRATIAPAGAAPWLVELDAATSKQLDGWAARWVRQYGAVCRNHAWSPRLRDTGMQCLSRAERTLGATTEVLATPGLDASRVDAILGRLPRPESCADPAYLDAIVAPPEDPVLAATVAGMQRELARVNVLAAAGKLAEADAVLVSLEPRAAKVEYPPLHAQRHHAAAVIARWRGDDQKAFPLLHDVYFEARLVGDRTIAASAASEAALALLNLSRDAEASEWSRLAEVEIVHIVDVATQVRGLTALSTVATSRNEPERGLALAERAIAFELHGDDKLGALSSHLARAQAYNALGKFDLELAECESLERTIGSEFPPVLAQVMYQRALALDELGRYAEAVVAARRALALAEATVGPDGDVTASAVGMLGIALNHAGALAESLVMLDRSLALDRRVDGERSYNVASDLNNRCDLLTRLHRYDEAIASCRSAIEIWTEVSGADAQELGLANFNMALAALEAKRLDDVLAMATAGLASFAKQPAHPAIGMLLLVRGTAHLERGDLAAARADLERALEPLHAARPDDAAWYGWEQLELAKLNAATGRAVAARPLALAAREMFRAHGDAHLAEADALLARLGPP